MNQEEFGIIYGTGNVFRDLGHLDPDCEQLRAVLASGQPKRDCVRQ